MYGTFNLEETTERACLSVPRESLSFSTAHRIVKFCNLTFIVRVIIVWTGNFAEFFFQFNIAVSVEIRIITGTV